MDSVTTGALSICSTAIKTRIGIKKTTLPLKASSFFIVSICVLFSHYYIYKMALIQTTKNPA